MLNDETSSIVFDHVYETLVTGRYWWLPGADTAELRNGLDEIFDRYDVRIIAPKFGCSISEPEAIAAHRELLDQVLKRAGEAPSLAPSLAWDRWEERNHEHPQRGNDVAAGKSPAT